MTFGPEFTGDLSHWHYNTFEAVYRNRVLGRGFVNFKLDFRGNITGLEIPDLATFTRVPGGTATAGAGSN
jgi:hypothetical protein